MDNNNDIIALYETISSITDQMLAAARTGDWEQLAVLESRCSDQIEIIKSSETARQPLPPAARERKTRIIRKILDDDRQIRDITEPWMSRLAALINTPETEFKLSQSYGKTSRL